ncbi:hypothetical protein ACFYSC_21755 [Streptosporangium sp. NPDC004379]|uniref:hypothetical protein n=1 Tax=Streptosporangium sp. NPDC004379 TaxID=3366189 RepID=UPI0036BB3F74
MRVFVAGGAGVPGRPEVIAHRMTTVSGEPDVRRPDHRFAVTGRPRAEGFEEEPA